MFFTEEPYRSPILFPKSDLPKSLWKIYWFCQSFSYCLLMIGIVCRKTYSILIRFSSGMWHPLFVWPHYIRVLKLCQALFETFFTFCEVFELFFAVLDFLLLIRTLSSVSRLSLFRSSCLVATGTLYTCSPTMSSTFLKNFQEKFLLIDLERKRAGVFSLFTEKEQNFFLVLPFLSMEITWKL